MDYKRVLMLRFTNGMSSREIAETTGDGKTTVNEFLKRFHDSGELSYPLPEEVTNEFIEGVLYRKAGNPVNSELYRDFDEEEVHRALTRKGETLKHLWKKYNAAGTVNGRRPLSYRQFCRRYEYLERKKVKVGQDFSFTFDKVHYSMPRKYLKKTLEVRAGATKIYVYNENGDLVRTHDRSYTPKSWVVIPSDMPREYSDYGYWNKPHFLAKAERVGPETKILIQRVIEKFD